MSAFYSSKHEVQLRWVGMSLVMNQSITQNIFGHDDGAEGNELTKFITIYPEGDVNV